MHWLSNPGLKQWKNKRRGPVHGTGSKGEPAANLGAAKNQSQDWQKLAAAGEEAGKVFTMPAVIPETES